MSRSISVAAAELAACAHPDDQIQELRTVSGRLRLFAHRCSDCGAIRYREPSGWTSWTRPVLVAHVCGAVNHAGEEP
jgi:hypothetical protein